LRMDFNCQVNPNHLQLNLGEHKGSYPAWWHEIQIEIYGWSPQKRTVRMNDATIDSVLATSSGRLTITIPDDGRGAVLDIE